MEMSGSSHHPLCIKPVQKKQEKEGLGSERETPTAPFPQHLSPHPPQPPSSLSSPLLPGRGFLPGGLRPALPLPGGGLRGPVGGCGGWARAEWAGAAGPAGGCGAGPGLRSRPLPPHLRAASPPPLRGSGGSGATGMQRGAGARRRWLLLAALLGALCGAAAGGGGRRRAASLGEMLREVEALMEDTQHKLRNAVQEVRGRRPAGGGGPPGGGRPLLSPHSPRAGPHLTAPAGSAGVSPAFIDSCQRPPLRVPSAGPGRCVRRRKPAAGPARAPRPVRSLFLRQGERENPVSSASTAAGPPGAAALLRRGRAGDAGGTGAAARRHGGSLLCFWRCSFSLEGSPAPLLASCRATGAPRGCCPALRLGVRRQPVPVLPPPWKATPLAAVRAGSE